MRQRHRDSDFKDAEGRLVNRMSLTLSIPSVGFVWISDNGIVMQRTLKAEEEAAAAAEEECDEVEATEGSEDPPPPPVASPTSPNKKAARSRTMSSMYSSKSKRQNQDGDGLSFAVCKVLLASGLQVVLSVPAFEMLDWMTFLKQITMAAQSCRQFRIRFGTGLPIVQSAGEQLAAFADSSAGKAAMALGEHAASAGLMMVGVQLDHVKKAAKAVQIGTEMAIKIELICQLLSNSRHYGCAFALSTECPQCAICFSKFPTATTREALKKKFCYSCGRVVWCVSFPTPLKSLPLKELLIGACVWVYAMSVL